MACDVESLSHKSHGSRDNCIKTACDVESLSHKSDGSRDNCIKTACDVESPSHWIAICSHWHTAINQSIKKQPPTGYTTRPVVYMLRRYQGLK